MRRLDLSYIHICARKKLPTTGQTQHTRCSRSFIFHSPRLQCFVCCFSFCYKANRRLSHINYMWIYMVHNVTLLKLESGWRTWEELGRRNQRPLPSPTSCSTHDTADDIRDTPRALCIFPTDRRYNNDEDDVDFAAVRRRCCFCKCVTV